MRTKHKQKRPARQEMAVASGTAAPGTAASKPARRADRTIDDWADGEDMLEGLGGIDPDYDRADDAVPPELRAQWRPSRFEGE